MTLAGGKPSDGAPTGVRQKTPRRPGGAHEHPIPGYVREMSRRLKSPKFA